MRSSGELLTSKIIWVLSGILITLSVLMIPAIMGNMGLSDNRMKLNMLKIDIATNTQQLIEINNRLTILEKSVKIIGTRLDDATND